MMKKLCAKQGCNRLVEIGHTYCEIHQKEYEEKQKARHREYKQNRKDEKEQKFYVSNEWQMVKKYIMQKYHGLCLYSLIIENRIVFADVVHHIVPIKERWDLRLNEDNLITLSNSKHEYLHKLLRDNPDTYWEIMDKLKREVKKGG
jgi:5-methylcytosine-specific restriction endonuclease McrA